MKSIRLVYPETLADPLGPLPPLAITPTHLELNLGSLDGSVPSFDLLRALFTSASTTLVSLDLCFDTEDDVDVLNAIAVSFALVAPRLRRLTLSGSPPAVDFVPLLSGCTRLESLCIETFTHSKGDWIPTLDAIGRCIPSSLRHLTVSGYPFRSVTRDVVQILSRPGFSGLLQLHYPSFRPQYLSEVDLLVHECERRAIRVAFRDDLLS